MRSVSHFLLFVTVALASFATCTPMEPAAPWVAGDGGAAARHQTTGVLSHSNGKHLGRGEKGPRADMTGRPSVRREIRDLHANYPDQFALYMLGLLAFQNVDQSDPLSYYSITGIHARPYVVWQDAVGTPGVPISGYCPHTNRLFLTWHRPYLALFEQELFKHVKAISYQAKVDVERWAAAAESLRLPYWDTALGTTDGGVPELFTSPKLTINGPDGSEKVINNPLYSYEFHPVAQEDFLFPFNQWNRTLRWPSSSRFDAISQPGAFQKDYLSEQRARQDGVSSAFQKATFNSFCEALEAAHGYMHNTVGGVDKNPNDGIIVDQGHMTQVDYSAFDPLFMLHHTNIDRLMALYQAANPNVWLQPENVGDKWNFWIPRNSVIDANWPLKPFWKDSQSFWTSNDIRNTEVFGYVYPETQYWNYNSDGEWRDSVKSAIAKLYSPSARAMLTGDLSSDSFANVLDGDNTFIDWTINISASSAEMPSTFRAVFALTGDFSSDPSIPVGIWSKLMAEVEGKNTWKAYQAERKATRGTPSGSSMDGTVSLTSSLLALIKEGKLESLEPHAVVPHLQSHLTWNVYAGDDQTQMSRGELDSFVVVVISTKARIPESPSQSIEYSIDTTSYPEITKPR